MHLEEESGISANTVEDVSGPVGEDEVGLRAYVLVLAAWWREIVLGAFLAAAAGGTAVLVQEKEYEAVADVLIVQESLSLDGSFKGLSKRDARLAIRLADREAQRNTIIELAKRDEIAEKAAEKLSGLLKEEQSSTAVIRSSVSAEMVVSGRLGKTHGEKSNLLRITARADSPEKAAVIADTWAEEYMARVNRLYERAPSSLRAEFQDELRAAAASYENAQAELEASISRNRVGQLKRLIKMNKETINSSRNTWRRLSDRLHDARSLLEQIEKGGESGAASNGPLIQLLKIRVFFPERRDIRLRLHEGRTPYPGVAEQVAEVETIIATIENRLKRLGREEFQAPQTVDSSTGPSNVDGRSDENDRSVNPSLVTQNPGSSASSSAGHLPPPRGSNDEVADFDAEESPVLWDAVARLEEANRTMQARVEHESSTQSLLTETRDRTLSLLKTLQNTADDLRLIDTISSPKLHLMSPAVVPKHSVGPSPGFVAVVVGAVALPFLVYLVFLMNSLGVRPLLGRWGMERSGQA